MFVSFLVPGNIANPSWADIERSILALNECDGVLLATEGEAQMGIGCGGGGKYIVYETPDNWTFHNLLGDPSLEGEETLCIGVPGGYKRRTIVTLAQVLKVAKKYAERGELESSETWETQ